MKPESTRKILVAGMGTSPAVLTNAVWALAHHKKLQVLRGLRENRGSGIICMFRE